MRSEDGQIRLAGRNQEVSADSCDGPLDFMDAFALATDERRRGLRVNFRPKCDPASNFDPARFGAKRLEQQRDWRISDNMTGVQS